MKKVALFALVAAVAIWLTLAKNRERVWEWVKPHYPAPKAYGAQTRVDSYNGACQLTIDDSWTETKRRYSFDNMLLDIQVALKAGRASVIVLAEPLSNAKYYDLSKFSEYASNFTRSKMENGTIFNGPIDTIIGGLKGHQYVIKGRMEDRDIVILHTSLQE